MSSNVATSLAADDDLPNLLMKAGLERMTTLRDLQAGMLQALEEIKDRNDTIDELKATLEDRDKSISDLTRELQMLKAVLENPLSETPSTEHLQHIKRIAISAAPVNVHSKAVSESYAKYPAYV